MVAVARQVIRMWNLFSGPILNFVIVRRKEDGLPLEHCGSGFGMRCIGLHYVLQGFMVCNEAKLDCE